MLENKMNTEKEKEREKRIGFQIRSLNHEIKRHAESEQPLLLANKMTGMHSWVIGYLADHSEQEIYQKDIEKKFSIRPSTASVLLSNMEKRGLITRESVGHDARLKRIVLTDDIRELDRNIKASLDALEKRMRNNISVEELDAFFETIKKIKANLEDTPTND